MNDNERDYSNTTIDKKTAIEIYGSEGHKNAYEKFKKINSKSEKGLIKTLNQYYDSVEKVKVGRAVHYSLGNKRDKTAEREDKRTFVGVKGVSSLPYTLSMDIYIAHSIQACAEEHGQTYNRWLREFDIISYKLSELMSSHFNSGLRNYIIKNLIKKRVLEDTSEVKILDDYLSAVRELIGQFEKSIKRLEKIGAIDILTSHYKLFKITTYKETRLSDGSLEIEEDFFFDSFPISKNEYDNYKSFEKSLREEHGVTSWESNNLVNKSSVRNFKQAINESHRKEEEKFKKNGEVNESISLQYYYKKHCLDANKDNDAVEIYLKSFAPDLLSDYLLDKEAFIKFHIDKFHKGRYDRVKELTDKKMQKKIDKALGSMKNLGVKKVKNLSLQQYRMTIDSLQYEYRPKRFRGGEDDYDEFSDVNDIDNE